MWSSGDEGGLLIHRLRVQLLASTKMGLGTCIKRVRGWVNTWELGGGICESGEGMGIRGWYMRNMGVVCENRGVVCEDQGVGKYMRIREGYVRTRGW